MKRRLGVIAGVFLVACASPPAEAPPRPPDESPQTTAPPATLSPTTSEVLPSTTAGFSITTPPELEFEVATYPVPAGSRPHDVAPAADGGIWYTAQRRGALGWLDSATGETRETPLGLGSAPHGVIVGPDGAPWVTDGGLNAIVRVDPNSLTVEIIPLPAEAPRRT